MTLRDRLLATLEQERKAIEAAIFLIQSSKCLDAIDLETAAVTPVRTTRPRATPPPTDDTTEGD